MAERTTPASHAWHTLPASDALAALESTERGLDPADVEARRERYGRNTLPVRKPPTLATIVLHQFLSPLIYILLAAAAVAIALGDLADAGFIVRDRVAQCGARRISGMARRAERHGAADLLQGAGARAPSAKGAQPSPPRSWSLATSSNWSPATASPPTCGCCASTDCTLTSRS
jgi:hypothetical protein